MLLSNISSSSYWLAGGIAATIRILLQSRGNWTLFLNDDYSRVRVQRGFIDVERS